LFVVGGCYQLFDGLRRILENVSEEDWHRQRQMDAAWAKGYQHNMPCLFINRSGTQIKNALILFDSPKLILGLDFSFEGSR
jgi:hypothetical protein